MANNITGALNKKALPSITGSLYIASSKTGYIKKDVGAVRTLQVEYTSERVAIDSDNQGTIISFSNPSRVVSAEILEIEDASFLYDIMPLSSTYTQTAGVATAVATEALGTGWTVGTPIKLLKKNGNNTVVSSIVIDADTVALTDGTDYDVYVGNGENGKLGFTYIVPLTAQSGVLDADYSYTPNASQGFTDILESAELPDLKVWIEGEDETGKMRKHEISSANISSSILQKLQNVGGSGAIEGSTISFDMNKKATYTYYDEINV